MPVAVAGVAIPELSVPLGLGWGLPAVFLAILGDIYARAAVNVIRFYSGAWRKFGTPTAAD